MKYERLHGHIFKCILCGSSGRWLWWWNRRNGINAHFMRICPSCGRNKKWKFLRNDLNQINHGCKGTMNIYSLAVRGEK